MEELIVCEYYDVDGRLMTVIKNTKAWNSVIANNFILIKEYTIRVKKKETLIEKLDNAITHFKCQGKEIEYIIIGKDVSTAIKNSTSDLLFATRNDGSVLYYRGNCVLTVENKPDFIGVV